MIDNNVNGTIGCNESPKQTEKAGRPKCTLIRKNQPNITLMANAFINLYNKLGTVDK